MGRRLGILGFAVVIAVVAAALLYGFYAALQSNNQTSGSSDESSPQTQTLSGGWDEENVRQVQTKLRDAGFYSGEIDGAYSTDLAAALIRYQIRNGLPISGQLDGDTSKALGAKPAAASIASTREQSSETWRRLRLGDKDFPGKKVWRAPSLTANKTGISPGPAPAATAPGKQLVQVTGTPANEAVANARKEPPRSTPAATENKPSSAHAIADIGPASTPAVAASDSSTADISEERLRDYVGAFVLAGLDPNIGSEADFFADRVQYYDEGMKDREKIRKDLQRYDSRWPGRKFWLAGDIKVEPQKGNRVRVTFPLRYELRNGANHKSGKINKTLILAPAGNDLEIVAVNERKAKL